MLFTAGNCCRAGDHHAAVPDVPAHPAAGLAVQRLRADVQLVPRRDPDPCGVPERVLHVRAQQLHEDHPARAHRGGAGRRASVFRQFWQIILPLCRPAFAALATLLTSDLQRLLLGLVLFQTGPTADHLGHRQPAGQYFSNQNLIAPARCSPRSPPWPSIWPCSAVRQRPHARRQQGLSPVAGRRRLSLWRRENPTRPA